MHVEPTVMRYSSTHDYRDDVASCMWSKWSADTAPSHDHKNSVAVVALSLGKRHGATPLPLPAPQRLPVRKVFSPSAINYQTIHTDDYSLTCDSTNALQHWVCCTVERMVHAFLHNNNCIHTYICLAAVRMQSFMQWECA